ncbi:MAG: Mbeg1-like protein [Clostridia bacterium]
MGNITDFVKNQGGKTFAELPFTPTDAAVLCQLSYLKFEHIFPEKRGGTLLKSMSAPNRELLFEDSRFGDNQREIYFEAAFSRRYQNMKISHIQSVKDDGAEVCFCGMVFSPEDSAPAVVFRGTDQYIVGWKEDFKMAFMSPVPSQTMSAEYLKSAAKAIRGGFFICGHSKGGNLAVYSALNSSPEIRRRIKMIYNLDGPGFRDSVTDAEEYKELRGRITKIIPQKSFVGRLLQNASVCRVVDSQGMGILQHDIFNWNVDEFGDFIFRQEGLFSAKMMNTKLSENIAALSPEQIEQFVEALFGIVKTADVDNLVEFSENWAKNGRKILDAYIDIDSETRRLLAETVTALILK